MGSRSFHAHLLSYFSPWSMPRRGSDRRGRHAAKSAMPVQLRWAAPLLYHLKKQGRRR
nr:MAG TPA: hypothetical protein [Caudoviricetes sp.]